jgi:hypothetical protein
MLIMNDMVSNRPFQVRNEGPAGPFLLASVDQLDALRQLFAERQVKYWVEENAISMDGGPFIAVVNFGRNADPAHIQELLDRVNCV